MSDVPKPLNPRDADSLVAHLESSDFVRITTTELLHAILTVKATNAPTQNAPQVVLTAPPITTTAQDELQQAIFPPHQSARFLYDCSRVLSHRH